MLKAASAAIVRWVWLAWLQASSSRFVHYVAATLQGNDHVDLEQRPHQSPFWSPDRATRGNRDTTSPPRFLGGAPTSSLRPVHRFIYLYRVLFASLLAGKQSLKALRKAPRWSAKGWASSAKPPLIGVQRFLASITSLCGRGKHHQSMQLWLQSLLPLRFAYHWKMAAKLALLTPTAIKIPAISPRLARKTSEETIFLSSPCLWACSKLVDQLDLAATGDPQAFNSWASA